MKTLIRVSIILVAAILVSVAGYAIGQTEWADQQTAAMMEGRDRAGGAHGEAESGRGPGAEGQTMRPDGMPDTAAIAAELGISQAEFEAAFFSGGGRPNPATAAAELGISEDTLMAAMQTASNGATGEATDGAPDSARSGSVGGPPAQPLSAETLLTFVRVLWPIALIVVVVVAIDRVLANRRKRQQTVAASQ